MKEASMANMTKGSSGLNKISGDILPMNRMKKVGWHFINFFENKIPDRLEGNQIAVKNYKVPKEQLLKIIEKMPASKILPRALNDIFWQILPYKEIRENLGPLKVLDIGCGSAKIFAEFLSNQAEIASDIKYTGVDLDTCSDWDELRTKYNITLKQEEICNYLLTNELDFNFIVSQSALEHIEHDQYVHQILADSLQKSKKRVIQIHMVPSVACHSIYGIHGYRHYNKSKLSKIAKLYEGFSKSYIFPLGNEHVNEVHKKWAMGSSRKTLRFTKPAEYLSIFQDTLVNYFTKTSEADDKNPTFYAFVIDSNNQSGKSINWGTSNF